MWLLPAHTPPHKERPHLTPGAIRLEMTRLLADAHPQLAVCDLELSRPGPSFTIDTLRQLQTLHPADAFRLIIGADMALSFAGWREAETILRLAPPLVALRPDFPLPDGFGLTAPQGLSEEGRRILHAGLFSHEPFAASSSGIRVALHAGDLAIADELLTPEVYDYIRDHDLYQSPGH